MWWGRLQSIWHYFGKWDTSCDNIRQAYQALFRDSLDLWKEDMFYALECNGSLYVEPIAIIMLALCFGEYIVISW